MSLKMIIGLALGLVSVIYPFVVYYGLNQFGPASLAFILLVVMVLRVLIKGSLHEPSQWLQLVVLSIFCLAVMVINSEGM